jgi:hypothetical protein
VPHGSRLRHEGKAVARIIKIRWSDLGSPTAPGVYLFRGIKVRVRLRDIEVAKGNPNAVFRAVREGLLANAPYGLGPVVEFPDNR